MSEPIEIKIEKSEIENLKNFFRATKKQLNTAFYIYAGCDKTMSMCKNKFKNFANFNGTPFIPKADSSL